MQKKWKYISSEITDSENFRKIKEITKNDLLARLLISRGIDNEKRAKEYINPLDMEFTSPNDFTDMGIAVERILKAVENGEFILIHGDFDADGITSAALLSKVMTLLNANYDVYIPNRETESHGLSTKAILQKKAKKGLKLVVTCDCATSDVKEIKLLKSLGIETIVTDHHEPSDVLPEAIAIINPKVEGKINSQLDTDKIGHLCDLAGVGVAFKLALGILEKTGQESFADDLLPLVAVGTVADIVPLLGENRAFVKLGMNLIEQGKNKGISELLKFAGVHPEKGIKSNNIAFQIAPRLNATGRLDTADEGYRLLVSDNLSEIEFLCSELHNKNELRKTLCDKIFHEAVEMYENSSDKNEYAIVLYGENWHLGVIGIVASKLVEKYNKPVLMMCKDPNSNNIRSSVRSVSGINIFELLSEMKEYFVSFGGHKGAAGLSFNPDEYSFEQVKQRIFELAKEYSQDIDLTPVLNVDLKIKSEDITPDLIEKLELLEPCGACNSYPVFSIENLTLGEQKLIGQNQNHLKFICRNQNNNTLECVLWNSQLLEIEGTKIDIAFYPKINVFNGVTSLQLDIQDAHYEEKKKNPNIYDHRKKRNILPQVCEFVTKNAEKVFIYMKNSVKKKELIDIGFPEKSFVPKENTAHLMLFEYPDSQVSLKTIIEQIHPQNLHFMYSENNMQNLNDFVGKILGMTKYASGNKNGEFDVNTVSKKTGVEIEIIKSVLEILNDINAIKIKSKNGLIYYVEYVKPVSIDKITMADSYKELKENWEKISDFKEQLMNAADEKELEQIVL